MNGPEITVYFGGAQPPKRCIDLPSKTGVQTGGFGEPCPKITALFGSHAHLKILLEVHPPQPQHFPIKSGHFGKMILAISGGDRFPFSPCNATIASKAMSLK